MPKLVTSFAAPNVGPMVPPVSIDYHANGSWQVGGARPAYADRIRFSFENVNGQFVTESIVNGQVHFNTVALFGSIQPNLSKNDDGSLPWFNLYHLA
jgi:hypothetical protein